MAKKIAFTITDSGIDGREPTRVVEAYWDEDQRNRIYEEKGHNKNYYGKGEQIVDVEKASAEALAKLDGLDRLLLGLEQPSPKGAKKFRSA